MVLSLVCAYFCLCVGIFVCLWVQMNVCEASDLVGNIFNITRIYT